VGHRGDVANQRNFEAHCLQRAQGTFAPRAGSLHEDGDRPHAVFHCLACRLLGRELRREGRALARSLKPREPALDHATVFPLTSVMVTTVLLNVDWMWAIPVATFFFTFFLAVFPFGAVLGVPDGGGMLVFACDMTC